MKSDRLPNGDRLLKLSEVAPQLRCSEKSVRRRIESRKLESIKVGGVRLVLESSLLNFIQKAQQA